jgi:hypothetical protein
VVGIEVAVGGFSLRELFFECIPLWLFSQEGLGLVRRLILAFSCSIVGKKGRALKRRLFNIAIAGTRALVIVASGLILVLSVPATALAQEGLGFRLPDSIHVLREPFFFPSLSFTPFRPYGNQLSLGDQAVLDNPDLLNTYNDSWKRSFLLGASDYRANIVLPSPWMSKKESFFQKIQAALGVAELAGAAYLGYKAIKKEPITKKK